MEIHFDAGLATLVGCDTKIINNLKEHCFKWIDVSIQIQNNSGRGFYRDPTKYAFDDSTNQFPTGLVPKVCNLLGEWGIDYHLRFLYTPIDIEPKAPPEWAWGHQKEILKHLLQYRRCIVRSPTASGKTSSISMVVDMFEGHRTLIVLHQTDLIKDMAEILRNALDIPVGVIYGGKVQWEQVTVASAKLLSLRAETDFKEMLEDVDVLIFDECHHYANNTGLRISKACLNSSYRLGLSATPEQRDGSDILLEGVIGPLTLIIPDNLLCELGVIHKPDAYFIEVEDPKLKLPNLPGSNKPDRVRVIREGLINNQQRNGLIVEILKKYKEAKKDTGCALILVEDVKNGHGERLVSMLEAEGIHAVSVAGATKQKDRDKILSLFKAGHLGVLVATKILNEGKDVPLLELVINAAGGSGERAVVQKVGRALRKDASGVKTQAIIVDFWDLCPLYLNANSKSRLNHINRRFPNCARIATLDELYETFSR